MSFAKTVPILSALISILIQATQARLPDDPHWVQFNKAVPPNAIVGGYENETLYIIRFVHEGSLTPGKYVPSQNQAIISYGGRTIVSDKFEILIGRNYIWIPTTGGNIPARAVVGGHIANTNEALYVGRINYTDNIIPGKAVKSLNTCFAPYGDKEVNTRDYEVLVVVQKPKVTTVKSKETVSKGQPAHIECKVIEGVPEPKIRWQFKANGTSDFVPIAETTNKVNISAAERKNAGVYKCIASNSVGSDEQQITLIVITDPEWVPYNNTMRELPADAIIGGYENENLYIIRFRIFFSVTPGKYVLSTRQAIVSFLSETDTSDQFEILCGHNYFWVQTTTNFIPVGAVVGGAIYRSKEPQYVGRIKHMGHTIPGRVVKSQGACFVPYGDQEVSSRNFEILVVTRGH